MKHADCYHTNLVWDSRDHPFTINCLDCGRNIHMGDIFKGWAELMRPLTQKGDGE